MESQYLLMALIAIALLLYGIAHGISNAWVWFKREQLIIPYLLLMTPVGVGVAVLACVPFIGWTAALTVIIALCIAYAPVLLIGWWAVFNRKERGL